MAEIFAGSLSMECHCHLVFSQLKLFFKISLSSALNELFRIFHGFVLYSFMWHCC